MFLATAQLIPSAGEQCRAGNGDGADCDERRGCGICDEYGLRFRSRKTAWRAWRTSRSPAVIRRTTRWRTTTVVDGTHLQMTLNKVHGAGATIAFGGLCGYGLEQTVDTVGSIRQVFPVIGSYSATGLYYAAGQTAIVGVIGLARARLHERERCQIAAIATQQQCGDGDDRGQYADGCEWVDADGCRRGGPKLQRKLCCDDDGREYADRTARREPTAHTGGAVAKLTGGYVLDTMAGCWAFLMRRPRAWMDS